jgi:hypothetical protein
VGTTQVFVASTLYGVMNLAAALDSNQFDGSERPNPNADEARLRRVLVISNNATLPEVVPSPDRMAGFELLSKHFDRLLSYNDAITPFHPSTWAPRPADTPLWQRYLRQLWELGDDDVHLIVESIQVNPAAAICAIFSDARIDVYADGLMSYGPTRSAIDPLIGTRIERLLYADLVPGLTPLLLTEWPVQPTLVPTPVITRVITDVAGATDLSGVTRDHSEPVAILLGQYLSALGIVSNAEEEQLHRQMLAGAIQRGHRRVIFKAHPSANRELADSLRADAARHKIDFEVITAPLLAEALYLRLPVAEVIGCFSTAMFTARTYFGIPVERVGTELMLERLTPYHNSNRIPVTIADALLPDVRLPAEPATLAADQNAAMINDLVSTVGYIMQPLLYPDRRPAAEAFLSQHYSRLARYFRRRRLSRLQLPGGMSAAERGRTAVHSAGLQAAQAVRMMRSGRSVDLIRAARRRLRKVAAQRRPRRG